MTQLPLLLGNRHPHLEEVMKNVFKDLEPFLTSGRDEIELFGLASSPLISIAASDVIKETQRKLDDEEEKQTKEKSSYDKNQEETVTMKKFGTFRYNGEPLEVAKYCLQEPVLPVEQDTKELTFSHLISFDYYSTNNDLRDCSKKMGGKLEEVTGRKKKKLDKFLQDSETIGKLGRKQSIIGVKPNVVMFVDFIPGTLYHEILTIQNQTRQPVKLVLHQFSQTFPFRVSWHKTDSQVLCPGLTVKIKVEFRPQEIEDFETELIISVNNGQNVRVPVLAYPGYPVLKTDSDLDDDTKSTRQKIANSHIECGNCIVGKTANRTLSFKNHGGPGLFFIITTEEWYTCDIKNVTKENKKILDSFTICPYFFYLGRNKTTDLEICFKPYESGTHLDQIILMCDNGESRPLDLMGEGFTWQPFYFSFQDELLKNFSVLEDDDDKVEYYIDLGTTTMNGQLTKHLYISNNSRVAFDFTWEIRDIETKKKNYRIFDISTVTIEPRSGRFEPLSVQEFTVTAKFHLSHVSEYRCVLAFYVLNLPTECITESFTTIRPTLIKEDCSYLNAESGCECLKTASCCNCSGEYFHADSDTSEEYRNVDVLVAEVEVWAEVTHHIVTLLPSVVSFTNETRHGKRELKVTNHNQEQITCRWEKRKEFPVTCLSLSSQSTTNQSKNKSSSASTRDTSDNTTGSNKLGVRESSSEHSRKHESLDKISSHGSDQFIGHLTADCDDIVTDSVPVDIDPTNVFVVEPDSEFTCTVSLRDTVSNCRYKGDYVLVIDDGESNLDLHVSVFISNQSISVDKTVIDFNSVKMGQDKTETFEITNETADELVWSLNQLKLNMTTGELEGPVDLIAEGNVKIIAGVLCRKHQTFQQNYTLQTKTDGIHCSLLEIYSMSWPLMKHFVVSIADVMAPKQKSLTPRHEITTLAPCGVLFVNSTYCVRLMLRNQSDKSSEFHLGEPFGEDEKKMIVQWEMGAGLIQPFEHLELSVFLTGVKKGKVEDFFIPCYVGQSEEPMVISVHATVKDLQVTFELYEDLEGPGVQFKWPTGEFEDYTLKSMESSWNYFLELTEHEEEYVMEETDMLAANPSSAEMKFLNVPTKVVATKKFTIKNETTQSTPYKIELINFGVPSQVDEESAVIENYAEVLLKKLDGGIKEQLVRGGQLVIVPTPHQGILLPEELIQVEVQVYSDTWGDFWDKVVCTVGHLPQFLIHIYVQVFGHPVSFPMFKQSLVNPTFRFGTYAVGMNDKITRELRVVNDCSVPYEIQWFVLEELDDPRISEYCDTGLFGQSSSTSSQTLSDYDVNNSPEFGSLKSECTCPSYLSCHCLASVKQKGDSRFNVKTLNSALTEGFDSKEDGHPEDFEPEESAYVSIQAPGRKLDVNRESVVLCPYFQIEPSKTTLEPGVVKHLTLTFFPPSSNTIGDTRNFTAFLIGCLCLDKKYTKKKGVYRRECGPAQNILELLTITAQLVQPKIGLVMTQKEIKFCVYTDHVLRSTTHSIQMSKMCILINRSPVKVKLKIKLVNNEYFSVYPAVAVNKRKKDCHVIELQPMESIEICVKCVLNKTAVMKLFRLLGEEAQPVVIEDITEEAIDVLEIPYSPPAPDSSSLTKPKLKKPRADYSKGSVAKDEVIKLLPSNETKSVRMYTRVEIVQQDDTEILSLTPELIVQYPRLKVSVHSVIFNQVHVTDTQCQCFTITNLSGYDTYVSLKLRENSPEYKVEPEYHVITECEKALCVTITFKPTSTSLVKNVLDVYSDREGKFGCEVVYLSGMATWNEKYKKISCIN